MILDRQSLSYKLLVKISWCSNKERKIVRRRREKMKNRRRNQKICPVKKWRQYLPQFFLQSVNWMSLSVYRSTSHGWKELCFWGGSQWITISVSHYFIFCLHFSLLHLILSFPLWIIKSHLWIAIYTEYIIQRVYIYRETISCNYNTTVNHCGYISVSFNVNGIVLIQPHPVSSIMSAVLKICYVSRVTSGMIICSTLHYSITRRYFHQLYNFNSFLYYEILNFELFSLKSLSLSVARHYHLTSVEVI